MEHESTTTRVARPRKLARMSTRALTREQSARIRARLRELSTQYGSQVKAGKAIGVSQQAVNRILGGDPAGLMTAKKLAQHDRVAVETLLDGIPVELGRVLRAHPNKWPKPAVSWVCKAAMDVTRPLSEDAWRAILDDVTKRLEPVLRSLTTKAT